MTVRIDPEGASIFKCHACGWRSSLADGLTKLNISLNGTISRISLYARQNDGMMKVQFKAQPGADHDVDTDYTEELKRLEANVFPEMALRFLESKGCTLGMAKRMHCAWADSYECKNYEGEPYTINNAIVFPAITRKNGKLICAGAQARELDRPVWKSKYTTIFRFSSGLYLFGEHLLKYARGKTIFVVEGPMDAMHIQEIDKRLKQWLAVGVFGLFISKARMEKIRNACPLKVVVWPDPDSPGIKAAEIMTMEFKKNNVNAVLSDVRKDPKQLTSEDLNKFI